jgi:hypothetical protein
MCYNTYMIHSFSAGQSHRLEPIQLDNGIRTVLPVNHSKQTIALSPARQKNRGYAVLFSATPAGHSRSHSNGSPTLSEAFFSMPMTRRVAQNLIDSAPIRNASNFRCLNARRISNRQKTSFSIPHFLAEHHSALAGHFSRSRPSNSTNVAALQSGCDNYRTRALLKSCRRANWGLYGNA